MYYSPDLDREGKGDWWITAQYSLYQSYHKTEEGLVNVAHNIKAWRRKEVEYVSDYSETSKIDIGRKEE